MKRLLLRTFLALLALAWPLGAAAVAPATVDDVQASLQDGTVHIQWTAPAGDVSSYRIYYSHQSILENNGIFDDWVETDGNPTSYDLTPPAGTRLFVAVLAVNADGEESATFGSEAAVDLPQTSSSSVSAAPAEAPQLRSARGTSLSEVVLSFSKNIRIPAAEIASAVQISDEAGNDLSVQSVTLTGSFITLKTASQVPGAVYTVHVSKVWSQNGSRPLDPQASTATFTAAEPAAVGPGHPTAEAVVKELNLEGTRIRRGEYSVTANFELLPSASGAQISSFRLFQSTDGGETFMQSQTLPPQTRRIEVDGIPEGTITFLLRAVLSDGRTADAPLASITLSPAIPKGTVASRSQVVTPTGASIVSSPSPLAKSGAGAGVCLAVSGAIVGWRKARRKKQEMAAQSEILS